MNESLIILNVGYALTFIALAIREVLWLRATLTAAQVSLFTYHQFYAGNTNMGRQMGATIVYNF